jgi:hypothetical protein
MTLSGIVETDLHFEKYIPLGNRGFVLIGVHVKRVRQEGGEAGGEG